MNKLCKKTTNYTGEMQMRICDFKVHDIVARLLPILNSRRFEGEMRGQRIGVLKYNDKKLIFGVGIGNGFAAEANGPLDFVVSVGDSSFTRYSLSHDFERETFEKTTLTYKIENSRFWPTSGSFTEIESNYEVAISAMYDILMSGTEIGFDSPESLWTCPIANI